MTAPPPGSARHTNTTQRFNSAGSQPADEPQFHVAPNSARPWLVLFSVGSGMDSYSITPQLAETLADNLLAAAAAARRAGGGHAA
jgi:hypothetical protein